MKKCIKVLVTVLLLMSLSVISVFGAYYTTDDEALEALILHVNSARSTVCKSEVRYNQGTYNNKMICEHISMSGTQNNSKASTTVVLSGNGDQRKGSYAETAVYNVSGVHSGSAYKQGTSLSTNVTATVNDSNISVKSVLHSGNQASMCDYNKDHNFLLYK